MSTKRQVTDALRAVESARFELRKAVTAGDIESCVRRAQEKLETAERELRVAIPKIEN
jgi:DNA-binding FrmR family transcriptional regulator